MATQVIPTTCPMDCPDTCALEVSVADGRIASIRGSKDHPTTNGFICSKVARFDQRVYHESRALYPMRRAGVKGEGRFERTTWEEAVATIVARFREIIAQHGAEAILPYHYGGSNGYLTDGFLDDYFFARLGASRLARTLCAVPATEVAVGMYGKMPGVAFEDYVHSKCIIIWGANPKASNIHLVPFLRQAKRSNAFIAVVDPKQNFSSDEVDLHLPVYPGADLPLALGMIRLWHEQGRLDRQFLASHALDLERLLVKAYEWPLERAARAARVPPGDVRRLADVYAGASPAVIRVGWGLERNTNGAQAMAAILAIPALLGKFGMPGGGYTLSNSGAIKFNTTKLFGAPLEWNTREVNMTLLADVLNGDLDGRLRPPVKALFVYNCNPAATVPDQAGVLRGLGREDLFTVVFDQVMTDTAAYADLVLPNTTFLEANEIRRGYGAYTIGGSQPVIARRGEAKPNEEVFALLGRAMDFHDEPFTWDTRTSVRKIAAAIEMPGGEPVDPEAMEAGRNMRYDFPGSTPVQFETVFPGTPDSKIHLVPACLGTAPFEYADISSDKYPLALVSPATSRMITSMMGEFNFNELYLTLNPADAAARGIAEGDTVRAFNDLGEVICRARVSDRVRQGVASMPKGAWRKSSVNGFTATALCPATVQITGGAACYNDARIEVTRG
jgi:anaerobic selenocysteine-containing dehydrogenase